MAELSVDEQTVLMLTNAGESIMAIGRWEKPCDSLVQKGYLNRNDQFNHSITDKGRAVLETSEEKVDENWAVAVINTHNAATVYRQKGECLAKQLIEMAKAASTVTGNNHLQSLDACVKAIKTRALEMLDE